jgi:hypothetical protein
MEKLYQAFLIILTTVSMKKTRRIFYFSKKNTSTTMYNMQIREALGKIKHKKILEGSLYNLSSKFMTAKKTLFKSISQSNCPHQTFPLEL